MPWLQAHLTVDKSRTEGVEQLFEELGALSVTLGDAGDEPMLEPAPGEMPLWTATRVTGLFAGDKDPEELRSTLNASLEADLGPMLRLEILDDQDWERAWLERFHPMRFGERLWICPSGHRVEADDPVVVHLDPGLAFGTGTHPTTALCLQWLDQEPLSGRSVIDFGCGSGILGIAALKLGAHRVTAVDHDPQALLATRANAERNDVLEGLAVHGADDFRPFEADVVVANILANVLVDLSGTIQALVRPGGRLALSGILSEQAMRVEHAYADLIDIDTRDELDGWVCVSGTRRE